MERVFFIKRKKKRSIFRHEISWRKQFGDEIGITKFGSRITRQNYFLLQRGVKKKEGSNEKAFVATHSSLEMRIPDLNKLHFF